MRRGVYPGTFDPATLGHVDVIRRGARILDELIVAIAVNADKAPLFPVDERIAMLEESTDDLPNVSIESFDGMAVEFVRAREAQVLLRGVRTVTDFEYEFQMAMTNRVLDPSIETIYVMASLDVSYISSRLVKEVAMLGGDVRPFVPEPVTRRLRERLGN